MHQIITSIIVVLVCVTTSTVLTLDDKKDILPGSHYIGIGYDPLTNTFRPPIFENTYSQQQLTNDQKFRLPDHVTQLSMSGSQVHISSELVESVMNYTDSTMTKMAAKWNFAFVSGSFSLSMQHLRKLLSDFKHLALVTIAKVTRNVLLLDMDQASMTAGFRSLAYQILIHMSHRTPQTFEMARNLINEMYRIYGIHCVFEADLGGDFTRFDILEQSILEKMTRDQLKMSGGASFSSYVGIKGDYEQTKEQIEQYLKHKSDSLVWTHGGLPWYPNMSYAMWSNTTLTTPGVTNKRTLPLSSVFTTTRFPEFEPEVIYFTQMVMSRLADLYIEQNTHCGCTDPANINFNSNFNKPCSCDIPTTFTTGGFYQVSADCPALFNVENPLTNDYTCPPGTHPVLIGSKYPKRRIGRQCHRECHSRWLGLSHTCHDDCWNYYIDPECFLYTYMCRMDNHTVKYGAAIGGLYSLKANNPLFSEKKCGDAFVDLTLAQNGFANPLDGLHICLAPVDGTAPPDYTVHFGGLFNDHYGNPLTKHHNRRCPPNYIRYQLGSLNGNPWSWCVHHTQFYQQIKLVEPGDKTPFFPHGHYWPKCNSTGKIMNLTRAGEPVVYEYVWVNASSPVPFWLQVPLNSTHAMKPPKTYFERNARVFPSANFTMVQAATFEEICFGGSVVEYAIDMMPIRPVGNHNDDNDSSDVVTYTILFYTFSAVFLLTICALVLVIVVLAVKLRSRRRRHHRDHDVYNDL